MSDGWIGVDLDGTLAHWDAGDDIHQIGEPVPAMLTRVLDWLAAGRQVKIVTARVGRRSPTDPPRFLLDQHELISLWCLKHIGQLLTVTDAKDFNMIELWDDRCVQVEKNTGRRVDGGA